MPITIEEEHQHIRERQLTENYDFDPPRVKRFFISNIFSRVFAHLIGWSPTGAKKLVCTSAGELKTAIVGAGYEYNDTKSGTAADTWSTAIFFDQKCSRVDIFIWDNPAVIVRSNDGITYQDEIEIPANYYYSFDAITYSFKIKNKTAGANARYQVIGWY